MDDVVIVGAGPAGSIAAIVLARAGMRVRLIDRARFPRHKLCGDTINPGAMAVLARVGLSAVAADALPVHGMVVTSGSGVRVVGRYGGSIEGRAMPRSTLDWALARAAVAAGAQLDRGSVRGPLVDGGRVSGVLVSSAPGAAPAAVPAKIVIAADGASSRIARALRLARLPDHPRRWAVGAYFSDVEGLGTLGEMHIRHGRYIGVAPMPGGIANACIVSADTRVVRRATASLLGMLTEDSLLGGRFARARMVSAPVCLGPLAVESSASGVPGCLLAGDASGFIDPMTGDGLHLAMRGAELAAAAALDELQGRAAPAHEHLARARRREFARKWRFNRALRSLVGAPIAVRAAAYSAQLFPEWVRGVVRYAGGI